MVVKLEEKVIDIDGIIVHAGLAEETLQRISSSVTVFTKRNIKEKTKSPISAEYFQFATKTRGEKLRTLEI